MLDTAHTAGLRKALRRLVKPLRSEGFSQEYSGVTCDTRGVMMLCVDASEDRRVASRPKQQATCSRLRSVQIPLGLEYRRCVPLRLRNWHPANDLMHFIRQSIKALFIHVLHGNATTQPY